MDTANIAQVTENVVLTRLGVDKVKPKGWFQGWVGGCVGWGGWLFDNAALSKIDDVLDEGFQCQPQSPLG